ncbi:dTMP kinase [Paenibacillus sp. CAA11]|uniref:dTMP kinase n=1 Tax=Paenibacillus sp. CAA11 TaxID=1532905 RepID=UPI0019025E98|nr:dTMP kinase [Paenibacillus sp. CAA11]
MKNRGVFITLEGGDGSGKTSMLPLLESWLQERKQPYMITREPGGIRIAEGIREIILNPLHTEMDIRTEALLYAAARSQHLAEKVLPALQEGKIVLCDRFIDSSLAYQGYARGLGLKEVLDINMFAAGGRFPDLTFYLDIEPEIGLARIRSAEGRHVDRLDLEAIDFHHKVREGYRKVLEMYPERMVVIDAARTQSEVCQEITGYLETFLKDF